MQSLDITILKGFLLFVPVILHATIGLGISAAYF